MVTTGTIASSSIDREGFQDRHPGIDLTGPGRDAIHSASRRKPRKAKIALSSAQDYEINLPFITADNTGPKHIAKKLTCAALEQLTDDLFERTLKPVQECLKDADVEGEPDR